MLRGYPSPLKRSLIANDVDEEEVRALIRVIEGNTGLLHRYLTARCKADEVDRLRGYDQAAPVPGVGRKNM
jgi:oligoendopeptidase F